MVPLCTTCTVLLNHYGFHRFKIFGSAEFGGLPLTTSVYPLTISKREFGGWQPIMGYPTKSAKNSADLVTLRSTLGQMPPARSPSRASSHRGSPRRSSSPRTPSKSPRTPSKSPRTPSRSNRSASPAKRRGSSHGAPKLASCSSPAAHFEPHALPQVGTDASASVSEADRLDAEKLDVERLAFKGQNVLRHNGAVALNLRTWAPVANCALPDGRICASDPSNRQLVLLSMGAGAHVAPNVPLPAPVPVQLVRSCGEGVPNLCSPYGVCARAASEADGCAMFVYVTDRYPKFPRVLRLGLRADGVEVATRLQWWDRPRVLLRDPAELSTSADGARLFVSDQGVHSVLVFDARTLAYLTSIGGRRGDGRGADAAETVGEGAAPAPAAPGEGESLDGPYGVAVHGTEVFVTEQGAHRVSVFSPRPLLGGLRSASWTASDDFRRVRTIGSSGSGPGTFRRPRGLAIVAAEHAPSPVLVVAEAKRVQVLSLEGEPLQVRILLILFWPPCSSSSFGVPSSSSLGSCRCSSSSRSPAAASTSGAWLPPRGKFS